MAVTLVFQFAATKIDTLQLDANLSEKHSHTATLTDHPVEEGADVSDHKQAKPDSVTIEGVITNTPINRRQLLASLQHRVLGVRDALTEGEARPGYAQAAYSTLLRLQQTGKLITVTGNLRTYENMMLVDLQVPRDSKTGDAIQFTATFRNVRLVRNRRVILNNPIPKVNPNQKKGTKAPKEAKKEERSKSILTGARDKLGEVLDIKNGNAFTNFLGLTK